MFNCVWCYLWFVGVDDRRYMQLLHAVYRRVRGSDLTIVEAVKKCAIDLLFGVSSQPAAAAGDGGDSRSLLMSALFPIPSSSASSARVEKAGSHKGGDGDGDRGGGDGGGDGSSYASTEVISAAVKQLNEDVAALRRIGRVSESAGIDGKLFLKSGALPLQSL